MSDTLYANDSLAVQREVRVHLGELTDAADSLASRQAAKEEADVRTRKAREEIKRLAQFLTEDEACALISALSNAIQESPFSHLARGKAAVEGLMDSHWALENVE